jgi:PAS domain S-box-containing protein
MSKAKSRKETTLRKREDDLSARPDHFLVVGVGASAGGVQALKEFFDHVPSGSGMAYVVILHLSPDHDSKLAAILRQSTSMPVMQVKDKELVKPDHVYVISPDMHLTMEDNMIAATQNTQMEDRRAPIDIFFRTLADSHHASAVGVILSGTGANGSMGIKRIKERGGAAFVQNPREAEFSEMPRNAIATEIIDEVLNVADIPPKIVAYKESLGKVAIPVEAEERPEAQQQALREIFNMLRARTGHDFANYKRPTLLRRIERRINVRNLPDLPTYAEFMHDNPEETSALLKDLLISVTNFFRDKKAFDYIESEILPVLQQGKKAGDALRIWVVGCATGEEAYSLAMLCAERISDVLDAPKIQIFATDIDEVAIAHAREGLYTINDAADVSPERLRRFFNREGDHYRIRREIRETILFAIHNVLKDPPFSHIDLATCRNMLIYLNGSAQERVMETMHFALRPGGYLFLGTSESADSASDLFMPYNREHRVYRSRQVQLRQYPVPESVPAHRTARPAPVSTSPVDVRTQSRISFADLHLQLIEQYAPPSVVVNSEYDILHLSERAGRYLQVSGGEPSQNLLKLVRPDLRIELRSALFQAIQRRMNVEVKGIRVRVEDRDETINIHIRPVLQSQDTTEGFILIIFEPATAEMTGEPVYTSNEPAAQHLEEELIRVKAQLRATVEQHEFATEELKASNEELQAINEEMRSAAEELETSKEELQSINEELTTVNQELKVKIEDLSLSSNNLQNLINSTNIGTIFLDRSFRLALFTPRARDIFNLIPTDIGRPISDITSKIDAKELLKDADAVLEKLTTTEREVITEDDIVYVMRISPYRTEDDRINGVVITFIDITERKHAEQAIRKSEERFRMFVTASTDIIYRMSVDWSQMLSIDGKELLPSMDDPSSNWLERMVPEEDKAVVKEAIEKAIRNKSVFELEHRVMRVDGTIGWIFSRAIPVLNDQGVIIEWFGAASDITGQRDAEAALSEHMDELTHFNRAMVSREARMIELKKEVNDLRERLGEPKAYPLDFEEDNKH